MRSRDDAQVSPASLLNALYFKPGGRASEEPPRENGAGLPPADHHLSEAAVVDVAIASGIAGSTTFYLVYRS